MGVGVPWAWGVCRGFVCREPAIATGTGTGTVTVPWGEAVAVAAVERDGDALQEPRVGSPACAPSA